MPLQANADERSVAVAGEGATLTVLASDASLREVINHIALHQQLKVESHSALDESVTTELAGQSLLHILKRLLRDYNFTLQTTAGRMSDGDHVAGKLWIFSRHPHAADVGNAVDHFGKQMPDDPGWAMQRISSRNNLQRLDATAVLTAFGGDDTFAALAAAVFDADPKVRLEAVAGLGQSHDPAARSLLEQSLLDSDPTVRQSAVRSVAERVEAGDQAALALLAVPLLDPAEPLRAVTVDLLADLEGSEATQLLQQALTDPSPRVRTAADQYLAER